MDRDEYRRMEQFQGDHWWYLGRRAVARGLLADLLPAFPSRARLLDVGCGTGEGLRIVGGTAEMTGVDMSAEALALAEGKGYASLHQASAETLPFPDEAFDGALALDVLEHVADDAGMLAECSRVLRPGGFLLLTVPAYPWLWSGHDEVFGHRRRYVRRGLIRKIQTAGFDVRLASYYFFFTFPIVAAVRLGERLLRRKRASHFFRLPVSLNTLLLSFIALEGRLLRSGVRLPVGSSLVVIARKPISSRFS